MSKKAQVTSKQLAVAVNFIFSKSWAFHVFQGPSHDNVNGLLVVRSPWFIRSLTFVVSQENCGVDAKD